MPFIYFEIPGTEFGTHVFPLIKYRLIRQALRENHIPDSEFISPEEAQDEDLLLVHTPAYLKDLAECNLTARTMYSELPLTPEVVRLFRISAGGTLLTVEQALKHKWAVNIGGGFHHAFEARAEGFCYINDLAVAARKFIQRYPRKRVLIVDLDLHQGNGTAKIFEHDRSIFTFSMHQRDLYPPKENSHLDIALENHIEDAEYLALLDDALEKIAKEFSPDLVLYQAGADPYLDDQLGSLGLTIEGLRERDRRVIAFADQHRAALAVTLGGGYAHNTDDTVRIHVNTCLEVYAYYTGRR